MKLWFWLENVFFYAALLEKRKQAESSKSRVKREGSERNLLIGFYDG